MEQRYYSLFLLLVIMPIYVGCMREEPTTDLLESEKMQRITAWMEGHGKTKTFLSPLTDGMYYPLWEEDDTIGVFSGGSIHSTPFFLVKGEGTARGVFEGPLTTGETVCLFPYEENSECVSDKLFFTLPSEQWYREESYGPRCFPMVAVSDGEDVHFKNLCSIIRLPIKGSGFIKSITVKTQDKVLAGRAYVSLSQLDSPSVHLLGDGQNCITLFCNSVLSQSTPKTFHIVVPSQVYDDLTIEIELLDRMVTKTINHEIVMDRSQLRSVTPFVIESQTIDLDHIPYNVILYKTSNKTRWNTNDEVSFDTPLLSNIYDEDFGYGVMTFQDTLRRVNVGQFYGMNPGNTMEGLYLPDGVQVIERGALPEGLTEFRVPDQISKIDYNNLNQVTSLIGHHVAEDGRSIVKDGSLIATAPYGIEEYVTPGSVRNVLYGSLSEVPYRIIRFSEGVRMIEFSACGECRNIEELHFPESIRSLNASFSVSGSGGWRPYSLGEYYYSKFRGYFGSSKCSSEDHICMINPNSERGSEVMDIIPGKSNKTYAFQEGINSIQCGFNDWNQLEEIILPESVTSITPYILASSPNAVLKGPQVTPDGLFFLAGYEFIPIYKQDAKQYVTPEGFRSIPIECFASFPMESVTISEGIVDIGQYCFSNCSSLRTVHFPTTITRFAKDAFLNCYESLDSVFFPVKRPPEVTGNDISSFNKLKFFVPEESLNDYLADPSWAHFWPYMRGYHFDITEAGQYYSSDYSKDGMVTVLQEATEGSGIDVVLAGECYTDRQIEDGTYLKEMEEVADAFFDIEPYKSFRHLFNVYVVNAISLTDSLNSPTSAFGLEINGTMGSIGINPDKCLPCLYHALPEDRVDQALLMIRINTRTYSKVRAGTCLMGVVESTPKGDYGSGIGLAAFTGGATILKSLVQHEAGGHGFAKLADEYSSRAVFDNPDDHLPSEGEIDHYNSRYNDYGWYKNIDFTSNPQEVKWFRFLSDARYADEQLGIYEGGAAIYKYGVYRPSEYSMMLDDMGAFNAPSREAIYYRIHKLAYGEEWNYDYEDFVRYDKGANNIHPTSYSRPFVNHCNYKVREPLPVPENNTDKWVFTVCD